MTTVANALADDYSVVMARESTMNVSLTPSLRNYVQSKVRTGGYESASEVVRESLRVLQERDLAQQQFWGDVRSKVAAAKKQAAQGKLIDGETAMRQIIAEPGTKRARPRNKARRQ